MVEFLQIIEIITLKHKLSNLTTVCSDSNRINKFLDHKITPDIASYAIKKSMERTR